MTLRSRRTRKFFQNGIIGNSLTIPHSQKYLKLILAGNLGEMKDIRSSKESLRKIYWAVFGQDRIKLKNQYRTDNFSWPSWYQNEPTRTNCGSPLFGYANHSLVLPSFKNDCFSTLETQVVLPVKLKQLSISTITANLFQEIWKVGKNNYFYD